MNYRIELGEQELTMIKQALDFYVRMNLGQFKEIKRLKIAHDVDFDEFENLVIELKNLVGLDRNSYYGIFQDKTPTRVKLLCEIHDQMRYAQNLAHGSTSAQEADICKIAKLPLPNFTISVADEDAKP